MSPDDVYLACVNYVLEKGLRRPSRSGEVLSSFALHYEWDMRQGFPLLTTKKVDFNNIMHELNWFLRGETNINTLKAPQLWSPWARESGYVGPIYGEQWVSWASPDYQGVTYINQIQELIEGLKKDPYSRRHLVSAWNPVDIPDMALAPCHAFFQCYVRAGFLDLQMYQRSADLAIGVPYNIASYGLLLTMLAREVDLAPGELHISFGDSHIYLNQVEGLKKQLSREPREAPTINIHGFKSFWQLVEEDDPDNYQLSNYNPHPFIKFPLAV